MIAMTRHPHPMGTALVLLVLVLLSLPGALAAALGLRGVMRSQRPLPDAVRIGILATDRSGTPIRELAGAALATGGSFSLTLPDAAPPDRAIAALVPDALDWPGLIGRVSSSGPARIGRAVLTAYTDADGNGSFGGGDSPWETAVTRGTRGAAILVWADAQVRVRAERGFDLTLEPGWNLALIDVGQTVSARRATSVDDLVLEIFRR